MAGDRKFYMQKGSTYIEKQVNYISGNQIIGREVAIEGDDEQCEENSTQDEAIEALLSFFFNDKAEVEKFVTRARAMKAVDVTHEVNRLIKEKKLSDASCMKPLWEVMTKHRLYDKKYNTWNSQVKR